MIRVFRTEREKRRCLGRVPQRPYAPLRFSRNESVLSGCPYHFVVNISMCFLFPLALERCHCRAGHKDVTTLLVPGDVQAAAEQIKVEMAVCEIVEHAGDC